MQSKGKKPLFFVVIGLVLIVGGLLTLKEPPLNQTTVEQPVDAASLAQ